jgi:hypothetical protein
MLVDVAPVPAEFVAVTVQAYVLPLVSPLTLIGLAVALPVLVPALPAQDAV